MPALYVFLRKKAPVSELFLVWRCIMNPDAKRKLLHLFFPTKCPVCGELIGAMDGFCAECSEKLKPSCNDAAIDGADGFCAAFVYDDTSSKAVFQLKDGAYGNAVYALGNAIADTLAEHGFDKNADVIIPVPLHSSAKRKRGCNQSELLAKQLSEFIGLPVDTSSVVKIRRTAPQKELSRAERIVNLKDAFTVVMPENIKGKRVILLDDVCTTGSTLSEITKILRNSGASAVYCAACCKTPPVSEQSK